MADEPLDAEFRERAERLALRQRAALGLTEHERLDPRELAEHLGVDVFGLTGFPGLSPAHEAELRAPGSRTLSAVTVLRDGRALIVVNDTHDVERQANSIAHELAHLLLEHERTARSMRSAIASGRRVTRRKRRGSRRACSSPRRGCGPRCAGTAHKRRARRTSV